MRLELDPTAVQVLRNERGEANAAAYKQSDGELLTVIGGVVLGVPVEVDGKLVFDHEFSGEAVALLVSRAATRAAVVGATPALDLSDDQFAAWQPGLAVAVGDVLVFEGVAYEVVQEHTTQADWTPPVVPALFSRFRDPEAPQGQAWQPATAYALNDHVTYQGVEYTCIQAHTSQAGWAPPIVPALWQVATQD